MALNQQEYLSEQLQLLHEFRYVDTDMPYQAAIGRSNKADRNSNTTADIRMLDLIAVCLITGKAGDVVATALDKHNKLELVLAKNGVPTPDDYTITEEFFAHLTKKDAKDWMDLFPFLITHSQTNIDKRISNLRTTLATLIPHVPLAISQYTPQSIAHELPKSSSYRQRMYGNQEPPVRVMISALFNECYDCSGFKLDPDQPLASKGSYANLLVVAAVLLRSRFLQELIDDRNRLNSERTEMAQKLKRRLGKVCQYVNIGQLISFVKRLFPEGDVPFHWVVSVFDGTGEGSFELCSNPNDAVCRGLDMQPPLAEEIASKLLDKLPTLARNWATRGTITTCVHAELRIILELSSSLPKPSISQRPPQLPIGCSKRSCICCALWMYAFNYVARTDWMTSGSHGKPYATWALPGNACDGILGDDRKGSVDEAVIEGIKTRLADTLSWLQPGSKRPSDEHVSSDGFSDGDSVDSADSYKQRLDNALAIQLTDHF